MEKNIKDYLHLYLVIIVSFGAIFAGCNNGGGGKVYVRDTIRIKPDTIPLMDIYRQAWWDGFGKGSMTDTLSVWSEQTRSFWRADSQAYAIQYRDIYIRPEIPEKPFDYPVGDSTWWADSAWYYLPIDTIKWITEDSFIILPAWNKRNIEQ